MRTCKRTFNHVQVYRTFPPSSLRLMLVVESHKLTLRLRGAADVDG
jgi:hypothetical protein